MKHREMRRLITWRGVANPGGRENSEKSQSSRGVYSYWACVRRKRNSLGER
jgi:hypothetical protein